MAGRQQDSEALEQMRAEFKRKSTEIRGFDVQTTNGCLNLFTSYCFTAFVLI